METLIEELTMILDDKAIPKNIRAKMNEAILTLQDTEKERSIRANKALQELDDISDDPNIPSYIRPQIWNIVSQLEAI